MNISQHRENRQNTRHASTRARRRGGFTLIEILVVLVIATLISGIIVSGFSSISASNRRTTCQTNMTQIYSALRLYAADADGQFPYYGGKDSTPQDDASNNSDGRGIGLWALYTFPSNADADDLGDAKDDANPKNVKPIEVYLRKAGAFHCPSDEDKTHISMFGTPSGATTPYNENYLSYQVTDPGPDPENPLPTGEQTYKTTRVDGIPPSTATAAEKAKAKRQLLTYDDSTPPVLVTRTPPADTVVTWCPWHRNEGRKRDIVLFYDGSIQSLDRVQDDGSEGWKRVPKKIE